MLCISTVTAMSSVLYKGNGESVLVQTGLGWAFSRQLSSTPFPNCSTNGQLGFCQDGRLSRLLPFLLDSCCLARCRCSRELMVANCTDPNILPNSRCGPPPSARVLGYRRNLWFRIDLGLLRVCFWIDRRENRVLRTVNFRGATGHLSKSEYSEKGYKFLSRIATTISVDAARSTPDQSNPISRLLYIAGSKPGRDRRCPPGKLSFHRQRLHPRVVALLLPRS